MDLALCQRPARKVDVRVTETGQHAPSAEVYAVGSRERRLMRAHAARVPFSRITTARMAGVIDHVTLNVADIDGAKAFYEAALAAVGYELAMDFVGGAGFAADGKPDFFLAERGEPSSPVHIAFEAADRKTV